MADNLNYLITEIALSSVHSYLEESLGCFMMLSVRFSPQGLSLSVGMERGSPALDSAMTVLDSHLEEMMVLQVA